MRVVVDANGLLSLRRVMFILLSNVYTYFKEQNSYAK